ncbi:MAG: restriction endonuclease [Myxococcales bacterium]
MGILVVAAVATLIGFGLILLIGRNQPVSPAAPENLLRGDLTDSAWVRRYGVEGLQRLLVMLFTEMGFAPERCERGGSTVDLFANDPTPIRGGRIYVHGILGGAQPVDGDEVRNLIDTARAEFVGKGIYVTLGRFSSDARDTAKGAPIDLLDGDELGKLMRKHLPQAFATRNI